MLSEFKEGKMGCEHAELEAQVKQQIIKAGKHQSTDQES